jgi:multidrug resistance efflux pump
LWRTRAWLAVAFGLIGLVLGLSPLAGQKAPGVATKEAAASGFVECRGFVYPIQRFTLTLRPGEYVSAMMVSKGERVKAGQAIARIGNPAWTATFMDLIGKRNDYEVLRDEIEILTLQLTLHRTALKRQTAKIDDLRKLSETLPNYPIDKEMEPLIDKKWELEDLIELTTARLAQSQARLDEQRQAEDLLKRELEATGMRMEQALVKAPFSGIVVERAPDPDRLSPESTICELWDDSAFLIEMEILQHQLTYVYPGQVAIVALDFSREEGVQGTVDSIEPGSLVPEASGHPRFKAIVKLKRAVPWLRPGMQVAVRVRSERAK